VIARVWRGWTKPHDADAYAALLRAKIFPGLVRDVSGFRGGYVLRRRTDDEEEEFVVMTLFDSLDAVRAFAGDDLDVPVIEPEAGRLLGRSDDRAAHYDVALFDRP
jgi:heme-degrading monooxygenase HmoA